MTRVVGNREKITDAAELLFAHKGYHATSIGDIARRAKVPKGSIYNYFDSKEALLLDIMRRLRFRYETDLRLKVLEGTASPADIVTRLLNHHIERFSDQTRITGDPLASRLDELANSELDCLPELLRLDRIWRQVVTQKIWAYATVASIPLLVDAADGLAGLIQAALRGLLIRMKAENSVAALEEAKSSLIVMVDSYVNALATGEVPPTGNQPA